VAGIEDHADQGNVVDQATANGKHFVLAGQQVLAVFIAGEEIGQRALRNGRRSSRILRPMDWGCWSSWEF
jgi:hypothetical protein